MEDKPVIVIDNGSFTLKVGVTGSNNSLSSFRCVVAKGGIKGTNEKTVFGEDALENAKAMKIISPIQRGLVVDWDVMEQFWKHMFLTECRLDLTDAFVALSEKPLNPKATRERITRFMFEEFSVSGFYLSHDIMWELYSHQKTSGVVVSSGYETTYIVPCYEGYELVHAILKLDIGGRDLTDYLFKLYAEEGIVMDPVLNRSLVRQQKVDLCRVALDYEQELETLGNKGGKVIDDISTLSEKSFIKCPEVMFNPGLIGIDGQGIPDLVFKAVRMCDTDVRRDLFKSILLAGGNCQFKGFQDRMQKELRMLLNSANLALPVNVYPADNKSMGSLSGGLAAASIPAFKEQCITKKEYKEVGPMIVHRKCF